VIIADWILPGLNGMDLLEEIDKRSPNSGMVLISGHTSVSRANQAMRRRAMECIAEPFKPQ